MRTQEISQAIAYFDCDWKLKPGEEKTINYDEKFLPFTRTHNGIIYAVYLLTDLEVMQLRLGMDENWGINNCAYDLFTTQGHKTRDNGILFCNKYETGHYEKISFWEKKWIEPEFNISFENANGMKYSRNFSINVYNMDKHRTGTIKNIIILYAHVPSI